jgi:hypothetical protein
MNLPNIAFWEATAPHSFSWTHKALLHMLEHGCSDFYEDNFRMLQSSTWHTRQLLVLLGTTEEALKLQLEEYPKLYMADEAIKEYLQVQPTLDTRKRMEWFLKRCLETEAYIRFTEARRKFLSTISPSVGELGAIASRFQGQHLEVEAGAYSVRDLKNVLPKLIKATS